MSDQTKGLVLPDADTLTYNSYLKVPELLSLQHVLSEPPEHDETLFIIIHQVYELWFKQILHEMNRCYSWMGEGRIIETLRSLRRVDQIQKVLIQQVDVLETMTPDEFNKFRNRLNPASGFQSYQFRILEFKLGLRDRNYLKFFRHHPEIQKQLENVLTEPSFYEQFLKYLDQSGFEIPAKLYERDRSLTHEAMPEITQTIAAIYKNHSEHNEIYSLMEAMLDLDEKLILWRYRHVAMVQRMIGDMHGTGGSSGADYLTRTLNKRAFPELWQARNHLG